MTLLIDSYLYRSFSPPSACPFSSQTSGMRHRARRFQSEWKNHLQNSRNEILSFLDLVCNEKTISELTILGAGDLRDVPEAVFTRSAKLHLIDASIKSLRCWKPYQTQTTHFHLCDITARLSSWYEYLKSNAACERSLFQALENIQEVPAASTPRYYSGRHTISLNTLSQLPIYWQESVLHFCKRTSNIKYSYDLEQRIIEHLQDSSALLIREHLEGLKRGSKNLLITDTSYLFIPQLSQLPESALNRNEVLAAIQENSEESSLTILEQDPLYGIRLEDIFSEKELQKSSTWIWKIDPHGTTSNEAEIHEVSSYIVHPV